MPGRRAKALCVFAIIACAQHAEAKTWPSFDGWGIEAVPVRGDFGASLGSLIAPQFVDGTPYVAAHGVVAAIDVRHARAERAFDVPERCSDPVTIDAAPEVRAVCGVPGGIALTTARHTAVLAVPVPPGARTNSAYRDASAPSVAVAGHALFAFAYAADPTIGFRDARRTRCSRPLGISPGGIVSFTTVAGRFALVVSRAGEVVATAADCSRAFALRGFTSAWSGAPGTDRYWLASADHVLAEYRGTVRLRSVRLAGVPVAIATTARADTVYALERDVGGRVLLAVVSRRGPAHELPLPVPDATGLSADDRGRLWLAVGSLHYFVVLTPPPDSRPATPMSGDHGTSKLVHRGGGRGVARGL
jgi:hypothetical protein